MMAAIFLTYAAIIWLVFDKLRLIRLSLPLALALAAVGPVFAFYVIVSMNNFHPSSADARVLQRSFRWFHISLRRGGCRTWWRSRTLR